MPLGRFLLSCWASHARHTRKAANTVLGGNTYVLVNYHGGIIQRIEAFHLASSLRSCNIIEQGFTFILLNKNFYTLKA
jgi:hypothetical protein